MTRCQKINARAHKHRNQALCKKRKNEKHENKKSFQISFHDIPKIALNFKRQDTQTRNIFKRLMAH